MPAWPSDIPQKPLKEGFSRKPQDNVLRSSMDTGPEKARRRFTAASEYISCVYEMTESELSSFKSFYENDINSGAISFTWPDPENGNVTVRIREPYSQQPKGLNYRISLKIEVLP